MPYSIYDMGVDEVFDTYEEARERVMEEVQAYGGSDLLEEAYRAYFSWEDLWKWCLHQEDFLDEFGERIANAEEEFCDSCIVEVESGCTTGYLKYEQFLRDEGILGE